MGDWDTLGQLQRTRWTRSCCLSCRHMSEQVVCLVRGAPRFTHSKNLQPAEAWSNSGGVLSRPETLLERP